MILKKIRIKKFRNYDEQEMIFEKGINYLYGLNGVGKTNLIEAIYYISNLESFRTNDDKDLIKDFKGEFLIEAVVDDLDYRLLINKDNKLLSIDGIVYKKYRDYLGNVNVIEFCPEEVYLLKDFPKDRRKFLDKEISKIDKEYLHSMLIYNKLHKQRNEVLKSDDMYKDTLLDAIDEKISELQVGLINRRKEFLKDIERIIKEFKVSLNDLYSFEIRYECCFEQIGKEEILNKYKEIRDKDKEKMVTQLGVHKDDFEVYLNGNEAYKFNSQGEQRFIVLLMKLALVKLVKESKEKCPILVLDDVFSELDEFRKKEVYRILKEFDQVFITGCNESDMLGVEGYTSYEIKDKEIKRRNLDE